jgi:hypothetical protein
MAAPQSGRPAAAANRCGAGRFDRLKVPSLSRGFPPAVPDFLRPNQGKMKESQHKDGASRAAGGTLRQDADGTGWKPALPFRIRLSDLIKEVNDRWKTKYGASRAAWNPSAGCRTGQAGSLRYLFTSRVRSFLRPNQGKRARGGARKWRCHQSAIHNSQSAEEDRNRGGCWAGEPIPPNPTKSRQAPNTRSKKVTKPPDSRSPKGKIEHPPLL